MLVLSKISSNAEIAIAVAEPVTLLRDGGL